jgi:DNA helicase HerA-like ATPase
MVDQFRKLGGKIIAPTDDDVRSFVALAAMDARKLPSFDVWLREQQPLFKTRLFKEAGLCPPPFLAPNPSPAPRKLGPPPLPEEPGPLAARTVTTRTATGPQEEKLKVPSAESRNQAPSQRLIPIGRRYERGVLGDLVTLAADLLPRHLAVLAGVGSGKTVFIRRIVEEAALLGIPSIVLDPNNDLSRLDDAWPTPPKSWSEEDAAKAQSYRACTDVVIWTPGVSSGNPISLNLLPDFAAIDDADEREQAINMAWSTLVSFLPGSGEKANRKKGVLADAIRRFAIMSGSTLTDLVALLADLPDGVSEDSSAQKLASEIADQLRAAIAMNPLLKSIGEPLDPRTLFESSSAKTRISVINLSGFAGEEARASFVNRLQMALFTFIKRNPSRSGRLYVIDEAQNFAPSGAGTACKASTLSLVAQSRKYGLGMIFATQTPKGIDNKVVSNCTTNMYGRMNAVATIDAVRDLMAAKGGAADDIGKLPQGEFYFSTEGSPRPFKVRTSLCLSWHPPNPPTLEEVIQKARSKRQTRSPKLAPTEPADV